MDPIDSPMTALWTKRAPVMWRWGAPTWPPTPPTRSEAPRGTRGAPRGRAAALVVGWGELHDEVRDPVLDLGERHGVDDLVTDAVVILAAKMRLAPEIVELDGAQRLGDLLRVDALGLLDRGHEREGRIGEVDAGGVPFAVLLGVARLPVLDLLGQRGLHVAVDPGAFHVLLTGDARHHRGVHLTEVDEPALEAEHAGLLDDQAAAARRRGEHADDVRLLGQDAQQ